MPNTLTAKQTFELRRRFREAALAKGNTRLHVIDGKLQQCAVLLAEAHKNFQEAERNDLHLDDLITMLDALQAEIDIRLGKLPKPYKR